jgi:signal transduction histidine kinase
MDDLHTIALLLVEDNPGDARLAREMLKEEPMYRFAVTEVGTAAEAITQLEAAPFDIALLDLSLPDTSGLEGLARLRAHRPLLPIVILTGQHDDQVALEALQEGAQDYLVKGIEQGNYIARAVRYAIERKKAELLLVDALEEAKLANRAKSEFLAAMSHELRTPLNAIIGFAEMMKRQMLGPLGNGTYLEYSEAVHHSGLHLLEIVNDVLDLAKIEAGKAEIFDEPVDVRQTVAASIRMVRERAAAAELELGSTIDAQISELVADRRKLLQILVNLLSNSVKFTPAGGKVWVTGARDENGCLSLAVSDTGIGMAQADIPRALMPFGQVDSALSRKYSGTGLGLPLTKRLVELHGGTLTITSAIDAGTTVMLRFPKYRAPIADPAALKRA